MTRRAAPLLRAAVVATAVAMSMTGCSDTAEDLAEDAYERALEEELGGGADVEVDEDSFTVDTEEGRFSAGAGELPEGFPADVPVVDGEVTFGASSENGDNRSWTVEITTSVDPAQATEQVRDDLEAAGFTLEDSSVFAADDAAGGTVTGSKANMEVLVFVADAGAETSVTYSVDRRGAT